MNSSFTLVQTVVKALALFASLSLLLWLLPFPALSQASATTVVVVIVSLWLMHLSVGIFSLDRMTIPGFAYLVYFLVIFLPSFGVYEQGVEPYRSNYLFSVESALITMPLGMMITSWLLGFRKKEISRYYTSHITGEPTERNAARAFLAFLIFGCGVALLHASQVETMPLLYVLRHPGEVFEVALLREESFKLLNSRFTYVFYLVRGTFFPFLVMLSFGHYLQSKSLKWLLIFAATLTAATAYAAMTIEKSPVAILILGLFLFYYLVKQGHLQKRYMVLGLLLFLSFPALVIALVYYGRDTGTPVSILAQIWDRFFHGPAEVLYYYFEVFPDIISFQYGASVGKLSAIMNWNTIDIPNVVGHYMLGSGAGVLASVSATACFLGSWNADFGLPGVLVGGLLAGAAVQTPQVILLRRPKTVANLAIYSFLMIAFGFLVAVPLPVVLLSGGVLFIFLISGFLKWFQQALLRDSSSPRIRMSGKSA